MKRTSLSDAIALLEECLTNGDLGKENLYAWFCGERGLIAQTIDTAQQTATADARTCHHDWQIITSDLVVCRHCGERR